MSLSIRSFVHAALIAVSLSSFASGLSVHVIKGESASRRATKSASSVAQPEGEDLDFDRRSFLSSFAAFSLTPTCFNAQPASSSPINVSEDDIDGIAAVTRSSIGTSIRKATVRSAQIANKLDEKWERFSDSLRDKNNCDPNTNRRLFDNGYRKDGTRIGNPVLGSLCEPEPLLPIDDAVARLVLESAEKEVVAMTGGVESTIRRKVADIDNLVGPSFVRARSSETATAPDVEERKLYNRHVYSKMRAYSDLLLPNKMEPKVAKAKSAEFELRWGQRLLSGSSDMDRPLIPERFANRQSFRSPFPALTEDDKGDLEYDEESLLDGLGTLSAALESLQAAGIIGHWEISIPIDDYGEVVTIAIDDDISLGAQALLREGRASALNGSVVTALTRAALMKFGIFANIDAFFLDPSTTKQEVFEPTQLLLNLSNIRNS